MLRAPRLLRWSSTLNHLTSVAGGGAAALALLCVSFGGNRRWLPTLQVIGKMYVSGDLQKPVSKFHGRRIEVHTDKDKTLHIDITEA
eukprot:m.268265 g.268265  ORF g.268265 m.268265 type:complete len:87 (+) comp11074_c3_seq8:645-905(+)